MYSLPIVRAIHFWHFFTEAVGIMPSCLFIPGLSNLGRTDLLWKRGYEDVLKWKTSIVCGIFRCTSWLCADEWLGSLSPSAVTQQGACVFSCCFDFSTVSLSGRGLFTTFPVGHSFWRPRRLNCYKLQQFVCQSGCSLDWAAMETKGSETMQQITKLRGKIWIGWAGDYYVIKKQPPDLKLADAAWAAHKRLNKAKNGARHTSKCEELQQWIVKENTFSIFFWMFYLWTCLLCTENGLPFSDS